MSFKWFSVLLFLFFAFVVPTIIAWLFYRFGKYASEKYQATIYPKKLSNKIKKRIYNIWDGFVIVVYIFLILSMAVFFPKGPEATQASFHQIFGYSSTKIDIALVTSDMSEKKLQKLLLPLAYKGVYEYKYESRKTIDTIKLAGIPQINIIRGRSGGSLRRAAARRREINAVAHIDEGIYAASRYYINNKDINFVMGSELSEEWKWMLRKGWRHTASERKMMPKEITAKVQYKDESELIHLNSHSVFYQEEDNGICGLHVVAKLPKVEMKQWFYTTPRKATDYGIAELQMGSKWVGNVKRFYAGKIKYIDAGEFLPNQSKLEIVFWPVNEKDEWMNCEAIHAEESSILAAISLKNSLSSWEELQPLIKELKLIDEYFIPWLDKEKWHKLEKPEPKY